MKKIGILVAGLIISVAGFSQTKPSQPDKRIQDAQRRADAGKADVIIARKKNIYDSTTFENGARQTANNKSVKSGVKTRRFGNPGAMKTKARPRP